MKEAFVIKSYFFNSPNKLTRKELSRFWNVEAKEWVQITLATQFTSYDVAKTNLDFLQEEGIFQIEKLFVKNA